MSFASLRSCIQTQIFIRLLGLLGFCANPGNSLTKTNEVAAVSREVVNLHEKVRGKRRKGEETSQRDRDRFR